MHPAQPEWLALSRRCLSVLCRAQHAAQAITVADQILARVDDPDLIGQVETEAARALWLGGRVQDLASRIERTLRSSDLDTLVTVRLRAAYALACTRSLPGESAARQAAGAVEQARDCGDREALTLAVQAAGEAARSQGRHQVALRHFRELRVLTGAPYLAEEITALQFVDRYDHAQALLDQARASCAASTEALLPGIACAQMWQDFNLGCLDDADAGARTLIELGRQLGTSLHLLDAITIRTAVALLHGETEIAGAQLRLADELADADVAIRNPGVTVMRGWLAANRGDLPAARDILRPVLLISTTLRGLTTTLGARIPWRLERSARDQPREVHTGIDSEFLEDVAKMSMDSMRGDVELVSDLPVGAPVRGKIGDHGLGLGQRLPPGLRPIDLDGTPSHPETAKPAPDACGTPTRADAHGNRQRLVERGDRRRVVAVLRQHPAEVFKRGGVGKRARSGTAKRHALGT